MYVIVRNEHIKLNAVGEFIKRIDILSNSTDKKRKIIVARLKEVLSDIKSARKKLRLLRNNSNKKYYDNGRKSS